MNSSWLLDKISNSNKSLVSKSNLIDTVQDSSAKVILTIGAGDIGEEVKHLKQVINNLEQHLRLCPSGHHKVGHRLGPLLCN